MTNLHGIGCLCENCQMTREHWQAMGMERAPVVTQKLAEAKRERTAILSDADLRKTWAGAMTVIADKEAAREGKGR